MRIFSSTGEGGLLSTSLMHACIDKSISEIEDLAFQDCVHLLTVDTHNDIRRIGFRAFYGCKSLRRINLQSAVKIDVIAFHHCKSLRRINLNSAIDIGDRAFFHCDNLESVEFGDKLRRIGTSAFNQCSSLKSSLKLPSIITIKACAFYNCKRLTDVELSEKLQKIERRAFHGCERLQRIAIPLKRDLLAYNKSFQQEYDHFHYCEQLAAVDLVGGIHKTVASLHMDSWRAEMIEEINRVNQVLPNTPANEKTNEIKQWIDPVIDKMDHYRSEHARHVREGTTLLVLALWKAKLDEKEESPEEGKTRKVKVVDSESARKERRITCGADIVIKNVLPFLQLE